MSTAFQLALLAACDPPLPIHLPYIVSGRLIYLKCHFHFLLEGGSSSSINFKALGDPGSSRPLNLISLVLKMYSLLGQALLCTGSQMTARSAASWPPPPARLFPLARWNSATSSSPSSNPCFLWVTLFSNIWVLLFNKQITMLSLWGVNSTLERRRWSPSTWGWAPRSDTLFEECNLGFAT